MKYADFFEVNPNFKPVIDASVLENTPDEWLKYYPHEPFIHILRAVLDKMEKLDKSVWIYGAYGTGKSHTALVLRKLFLESEERRVNQYIANRSKIIPQAITKELLRRREKKVLPVFTSGAEGLHRPTELLVRMQRAITDACNTCHYRIPVQGNAEAMVSRIEEDGGNVFWKKRDEMQASLDYLTSDITNVEKLREHLAKNDDYACKLLKEVRDVLEATSVFLDAVCKTKCKFAEVNASL